MSSQGTVDADKLSETQRAALINLLADDDPTIYHAIREKILSAGPEAGAWMEPHLLSSDPVLRRRAREIVQHLRRHRADTEFLAFCLRSGKEFDLEEASWLFATTEYPDINVDGYRAILDGYAADLQKIIDPGEKAEQILATINNYLFDELNFTGNETDYYSPENSYLNRVIDRRTGNPISLCLVYLLVARRLRLPLAGIGLPGHFVCRYQSTSDEIFLDAFNRGKILTKADCVQYLLRGNYSLREDFLSPVNARRMITRICSNLHKIYLQLELADKATRLQRYIIALSR